MSFYKSISDYYREIFPLQAEQAGFVLESFPESAKLSLLDAGCGTGDLTMQLSQSFKGVTGIDLDVSMLQIARKSAPGNAEFLSLNMLDIGKRFGEGTFNGILCFGNTLVHLTEPGGISSFIHQSGAVLSPGGKLMIQIINYDRILDQKIQALPTIETDRCRFERIYNYNKSEHILLFESILTIKTRGEIIRNQIPLYPLRKHELQSMLESAGFRTIAYFGNFKKGRLDKNSIPLVVEATI